MNNKILHQKYNEKIASCSVCCCYTVYGVQSLRYWHESVFKNCVCMSIKVQ